MSSIDVTKPKNHLGLLWAALGSTIGIFATTLIWMYLNQQTKNEAFSERLAARDLMMQKEIAQIQVDVAMIRVQVTEIYKSIKEIKK